MILNKRTQHRLRDVLGAEMLCPEFADNALYLVRFSGAFPKCPAPCVRTELEHGN